VNSSFSRRVLPWVTVALAAAFIAPAAEGHRGPDESANATPPPASISRPSSIEIDRLGPKHVPLHRPRSAAPVSVVRVIRPGGFDWVDAGIGAGAAGFALALIAGLAMVVTRRSRETAALEQTDLAGA
jgi:hypothetical protein